MICIPISHAKTSLNRDYVEITDPDSSEVIQFHDILVEAFPDPYAREDIPILKINLRQGSWEIGDEICQYHLIIARFKKQVIGGTSFYFFKLGDTHRAKVLEIGGTGIPACQSYKTHEALGIGAYLAVRKEFRGNGIGTNLIYIRDQILSRDAQNFGCRLKGLIIQVSDPGLMSAEEIEQDTMDPWEREKFWKRRGYRKVAFNFIQPSIREGETPVEYLALHVFPYCLKWENTEFMSSCDLEDIVSCFIKCTGTVGPAELDPAYLRMKSELAARERFQML